METGKRQSGFTLIEMLVVMGMAALLAAIIFPVWGAVARHQANSTCALNLKSIGTAVRMYREDFGGFPVDVTEQYRLYDDGGVPRRVNGLGLYFLYHLYHNGEAGRDPATVRYTPDTGDYLRRVELLHCPQVESGKPDWSRLYGSSFPNSDGTWPAGYWPPAYLGEPAAGSYNSYDWFYRRNWDDELTRLGETPLGVGNRHLRQAYPPDNTVITWCPFHRSATPPDPEIGVTATPSSGRDRDLVLWADGSVQWSAARPDQFLSRKP